MLFSAIDEEFTNDIGAGRRPRASSSYWIMVLSIVAAISGFIAWASVSKLEQITTGTGRVIPSSQIQVVQTLEGGIVKSISVQEGDIVQKDEVLAQIDDTGFSSRLGELRQQEAALLAERTRLLAEAGQAGEPRFSGALISGNPATVEAELELFKTRKRQRDAELRLLEFRLSQRRAELGELDVRETKLEATLAPLRKEAEMTAGMVSRGVMPEVDSLRLESRLAELEGELAVVRAAKPKLEAMIGEAEEVLNSTRNTYVLTARQRLTTLESELAVTRESIRAASDKVRRTQLRSPVKGIVNKINVTTLGAVLQPGVNLVEIVPIEDNLLIEARIRPSDVAFLKPDAEASIKLTAYDYLIYGDLKGRVSRMSADTLMDAEGAQYYQVIVKANAQGISDGERLLPIIPGMTARVDIATGENTVLSYLLKPVLRARLEAMRER